MPIDFRTFDRVINEVVSADSENYSVMLRGRHGIGKSHVVYQYGEKFGLQVVERRISQMTEGDIIGLPKMQEETTTWNPPDWFKDCCDNARLLFLDEVDRGTHEVRQSIFELGDSRKLNGWHLHPGTIVFAAVNGGEHAAHYQVGEMDPAALDRWVVYYLRARLEHQDDFEPNKVYPSRRSWDRLSRVLGRNKTLQEGRRADSLDRWKENLSLVRDVSSGFVGFEASLAFGDFIANYENIVTVEDIVDHGKIHLTTDWDINRHTAMVDGVENSDYINHVLNETQIRNLADYFVVLPSEVAMRLWYAIGKVNPADAGDDSTPRKNSHNFHNATTSHGEEIKMIMVELLSGVSVR